MGRKKNLDEYRVLPYFDELEVAVEVYAAIGGTIHV